VFQKVGGDLSAIVAALGLSGNAAVASPVPPMPSMPEADNSGIAALMQQLAGGGLLQSGKLGRSNPSKRDAPCPAWSI
jgi:hypothetical protein